MAIDRPYNVLFLCTHNSARSLMAEAIMNNLAINRGLFKGYSAGSHPSGRPNPFALDQIQRAGLPVEGIRSKDWNEFTLAGAPPLDFVFTVCDNAANEVCPVWPGQPMTAHWGGQRRTKAARVCRNLPHSCAAYRAVREPADGQT